MPFEPLLTPTGVTRLSYTYFPLGGATFNFQLSATTTIPTGILSGSGNLTTYNLSGTLLPNATSSTLTAASDRIFLRLGSINGNQDVYGYVTAVSFFSAASAFTCAVDFNDTNFVNTIIGLSANSSTCVVLSTQPFVTQLDNPFYVSPGVTNSVIGGLSSLNLRFRTVGDHCRMWNLNG